MTQGHGHTADVIVWISAGLATLGINTILTAISLAIAIILGGIRVYYLLKYGPSAK